ARIEVVLAGDDALAHRAAGGKVEPGAPRPVGVAGRELGAAHAAVLVVEGRVDQRGAELAFVLQVRDLAIVGIEAEGQVRPQLLGNADVEIVGTFGQRRVVAVVLDRVGGAREQVDVLRGDQFGRWRREVARIAGVQRGRAGHLPHHAHARTQLALGFPKAWY